MKILFHLGHPAHFHLFINTIKILFKKKHQINILIKKKDLLQQLLIQSKLEFHNLLPFGRSNTFRGLVYSTVTQDIKLGILCKKYKPDILIGTSVAICHVGKILNIPSINVNEDDAKAIPFYSYLSYIFSTKILSPMACNNSSWQNKTISYNGYHELAYLHPKYFIPNKNKVEKYLPINKPYFILRFAQLSAHHDRRVTGINSTIAKKTIDILKPHGNIYITSERHLEPKFEKYRLNINPIDIHHVLAFAKMYIGDSQTMAAEAAVLGIPALRFNDFVGKLGYLKELEHKYGLTYGIKTSELDKLLQKIDELLKIPKLKEVWQRRQEKMLKDKIDVTSFLVWFIENYPRSVKIMKNNPEYQYNFK
ncbi:DUF354 domain-containing protein [Candidatus Neomarinimicrobiota bacterium]